MTNIESKFVDALSTIVVSAKAQALRYRLGQPNDYSDISDEIIQAVAFWNDCDEEKRKTSIPHYQMKKIKFYVDPLTSDYGLFYIVMEIDGMRISERGFELGTWEYAKMNTYDVSGVATDFYNVFRSYVRDCKGVISENTYDPNDEEDVYE